ncbi:MAG: HD domain-containing protein [Terriglobales bacterium]
MLGIQPTASRFEHSFGVMCLVRSLGASVEQQAAALLHDVSHTAFSHIIDLVFTETARGSFHDDRKEAFVQGTDIPRICEGYGLDWRSLVDERRWPLLDQPAPRLCADRIDYALRDAMSLQLASLPEINDLVPHLVVVDGRIAFDDTKAATRFATLYLDCDKHYWSSPRQIKFYKLAARAVRRALSLGLLRPPDLWTTDHRLLGILRASSDPEIQENLDRIAGSTGSGMSSPMEETEIRRKSKSVDPDVMIDGEMAPLSRLDPQWSSLLKAHVDRRYEELSPEHP